MMSEFKLKLIRALTVAFLILLTAFALSFIIGLGGDCRPEADSCGEVSRWISTGILVAGVVGAAYSMLRILRRP